VDPRHLTQLGLDPVAAQVVGDYLAVLESGLPVGRRSRTRILAEISDGLACAVQDQRDRGASPAAAAHRAVAEFGDPRALAAAFVRQLGPAVAHRAGLALIITGPFVGSAWVAAVGFPAGVVMILAITVPAAILASTGAGRPSRHLRVPARVVTAAALVATIGCVAADLSLLVAVSLDHLWSLGGVVAPAVALSTVRLSAAALTGRRIAVLRAAAN
jgi:hypothetical protein